MAENDSRRKDSLTAALLTLLLSAIIVAGLLTWHYRVDPAAMLDREWPPVDSSEIVFGGEYVRLGDMPLPSEKLEQTPAMASEQDAMVDGPDLADAGEAEAVAPEPTVSTEESPMKVKEKPQPEKTGPTKEELAEQARIKKQKEEAERQAAIRSRMKSGFTSKGSTNGTSGSPNGNADQGALKGAPGHNLVGRTVESWGKPKSTLSGSVMVKVRVNRQGYVVGTPEVVGGTPPAASNAAVRQSCIAASRASRFSVSNDAASEQVGVITWKFE